MVNREVSITVPALSKPYKMSGDIYMGTVLHPEECTYDNYRTPYDYMVNGSALTNGLFAGNPRSGKTTAAMRFVAELARPTGRKRTRVVVLDDRQQGRAIGRYLEPKNFGFYSIGNPNAHCVKINPWKVPSGVNPFTWENGVVNLFCHYHGIHEELKHIILDTVDTLYRENGVFDNDNRDRIQELSSKVCFEDIYKRISSEADESVRYSKILKDLEHFSCSGFAEYQIYGTSGGVSIDEFIGEDDVIVFESLGIDYSSKNFIFGVISFGLFEYARSFENGFLSDGQCETVLIVEDADEIFTKYRDGELWDNITNVPEFEQMYNMSARYGLFIFAITQVPSVLPTSFIAKTGMVFAGCMRRDKDIQIIMTILRRGNRIDDSRDLYTWFHQCPGGRFVCRSPKADGTGTAEIMAVEIKSLPNTDVYTKEDIERVEALKREYYMRHNLIECADGNVFKIVKYINDFEISAEMQKGADAPLTADIDGVRYEVKSVNGMYITNIINGTECILIPEKEPGIEKSVIVQTNIYAIKRRNIIPFL